MFAENLLNNIVAGTITSGTLQTLLNSDANYRLALQKIYTSHRYSKLLALSSIGMQTVFGSEKAGELFVDKELNLLHHINANNSPNVVEIFKNKNATLALLGNNLYQQIIQNPIIANTIETTINANPTAFIVKRQQFTSNDTWTPPSTLSFLAVLCLGAGGNSVGLWSGASYSASGGSGGESKCVVLYSGFPTSPVTVTIGTASNTLISQQVGSTSFGSICTAVGGFNGTNSNNNSVSSMVGGGTTTNGGRTQLNGSDVDTIILQNRAFSQQGGNSGGFNNGNNIPATVGLQGTAGTNRISSPATTAKAGSPYGNGGGANMLGSFGGIGTGEDAPANSGSGAGASAVMNQLRNGGSGKVWLWWIE